MRIEPVLVEADVDGIAARAPLSALPAVASLGPLEVRVGVAEAPPGVDAGPMFAWSVANDSDRPVRIRSVAIVFAVVDVVEPLRMFRHGYQSWSPTGVAT